MKRFFWIALLITALRIVYLFFNHRDLDVEEAQYWTWSQHLALGYHSKPPMISWIIHISTLWFGNSEWALRLFSPVAYLFSALCLYQCGKHLYHATIGFWAGITVLLLPGVTYSATIISTDPFLLLFWSIALYTLVNACRTRRMRWWLGCGVSIGLGLLSKYTMLAFFLSMVLYLICSHENASLWKKPGPYLAVLVALLVFLPNVIWNMQHGAAAVHHVIEHNVDIEGLHFNLKNFGRFLLGQAGILGPIILIFLIVALRNAYELGRHEGSRLLLCFTIPMLALISLEALLSRAYANWAVAAYPSGVILTVAYMWEHDFRRWLKCSVWLHLIIAIVLCGWELAVTNGYTQWPQPAHPNWRDFGAMLSRQHAAYPGMDYLVDDRELWSKTLYYGKIPRDQLYVWDPQQRVDWLDNPAHRQVPFTKNFILITHSADLPISISSHFRRYQRLADFSVNQRLQGRKTHIYFYWLQGS
jgi:4-amino-4-deoxy-L-arabinose transferase-like glycosyltransferase